jgi:acylphosphatase
MKIKGTVRNLDDGSVELYSDLSDEQLDELKKAINNIRPVAPFLIKIDNIKVIREGDVDFGTPPDFLKFKGIRDDDEVAETLSIIASAGMTMQTTMTKGFDNMQTTMTKGFDGLGNKIDSMHADMNARFDRLDDKYGVIAQNMLKFLEMQEEHNKKLDEILEILSKNSKENIRNKRTKKN